MIHPDIQLTEELSKFYADPLGYVMFVFPWDSEPLIQLVTLDEKYAERFNCKWGPDKWACEFLDDLGEDIKKRRFNGAVSVEPIRYTTASGHGIGKSTLVAWLIKFILDTRPFSKGVITANTSDQLRTKTWSELGKWHRFSLTEHLYDYTSGKGAMSLSRKGFKEGWRCDAQTCREENSEAFQGLHAANSTPFFIFDEASAIPKSIWEARYGGATDGEPMSFDFGNPTRNSGEFYENCVGMRRHRYTVRSIDSRDVKITSKSLFKEWKEDYGEDSDFFKVRVRGIFPLAGNVQFIPTDIVEDAMKREVYEDKNAPLLIGVDVARFGDNDSVIFSRIGYDCRSWPIRRYNGLDTVQLVGKVVEVIREFRNLGKEVSGLFIDGGGIGGGVVDQLRHMGYGPIEVNFGSKPTDNQVYRFKGDEMWGKMREAMIKLILPDKGSVNGQDLKTQLTQREYGYTLLGNHLHLETKKDMQARGVASPDLADALCLTFAEDVAAVIGTSASLSAQSVRIVKHEYNPLDTKW